MRYAVAVLLFSIGIFFVGLTFWWEYSIWTECRSDNHSIMYCMRMLSK